MPDSLFLLPSTPQIKGLHTFIRNQDTPRDEFIFYSKRLIRLVIEYALGLLPFKEVEVDTPQGVTYKGLKWRVIEYVVCQYYVRVRQWNRQFAMYAKT